MTLPIYGQMPAKKVTGPRAIIVCLYLLVEPPVGGILVFTYALTPSLFSGGLANLLNDFLRGPLQTLSAIVGGLIFVAVMSYFLGSVQALITGVLISATSGPDGKFWIFPAVFAPALVGAVALPLFSVTFQFPFYYSAVLAVVGISASLTIRFLFRERFGKTGQSHSFHRRQPT